jgi:hypothetical protein
MVSDDLAAFVRSGVSIYVGTRDAHLEPHGTRVSALRVEEDGVHVVAFLFEGAAEPILRDLEDNGQVALAVSRPTDHRSCQLKGTFVESRPVLPDEREEVERQADRFLRELETIGIPRALTSRWNLWPCLALRVRVERVYEQTPGPGAGEPMR